MIGNIKTHETEYDINTEYLLINSIAIKNAIRNI